MKCNDHTVASRIPPGKGRGCAVLSAFFLMLALAIGILALPQDAAAQVADPIPAGEACTRNNGVYNGGASNAIMYYIARCISQRTTQLSEFMIRALEDTLSPVVTPAATIAIVLLAIKVTLGGGGRRPLGDTMKLMFKICFVYYLMVGGAAPALVEHMHQFMNGATGMAVIIFDNGMAKIAPLAAAKTELCHMNTGFVDPDGLAEMFHRFDCLFEYLIGVKQSGKMMAMSGITLAMTVYGLFFSGPVGAAVAIAAITLITLFISAMVQTMVYMTTILVSLALLFGIAPVVIPLYLFEQTKGITVVWFNNVLAYLLLPAILTSYMMMMLIIFFAASNEFYNNGNEGASEPAIYTNIQRAPDRDMFKSFFSTPEQNFSEKDADMLSFEDDLNKRPEMVESDGKWGMIKQLGACTVAQGMDAVKQAAAVVGGTIMGWFKSDTDVADPPHALTVQDACKKMASKVFASAVSGQWMIPSIRISVRTLMRMLAVLTANIILLAIMMSYMKRLLQDASRIVAKTNIVPPNLAPAAGVERVTQNALRNIAGASAYGKYMKQ